MCPFSVFNCKIVGLYFYRKVLLDLVFDLHKKLALTKQLNSLVLLLFYLLERRPEHFLKPTLCQKVRRKFIDFPLTACGLRHYLKRVDITLRTTTLMG